jgi:hypothetical protein
LHYFLPGRSQFEKKDADCPDPCVVLGYICLKELTVEPIVQGEQVTGYFSACIEIKGCHQLRDYFLGFYQSAIQPFNLARFEFAAVGTDEVDGVIELFDSLVIEHDDELPLARCSDPRFPVS